MEQTEELEVVSSSIEDLKLPRALLFEVVSSSIEDLSNNEAAKIDDGILEYSSFAKGDSWAHIV